MPTRDLSHRRCVEALRTPDPYRLIQAAVDGEEPILLASFVLACGDFLVPPAGQRAVRSR